MLVLIHLFMLDYQETDNANYSVSMITESIGGKQYKSFEFTLKNLNAKYDSFYVKEKEVSGYFTAYGSKETDSETGAATITIGQGKDRAEEGEYVINSLVKVTLPESGGPGTKLFYGLGISFVGFAGLLLFIKRRELRDLSKRRW